MERAEAEAILAGDRETAVALLMRVGELIEALAVEALLGGDLRPVEEEPAARSLA
ncbi:MAG TPA: hypothetical protein VIM05_07370 [Gaiellaceae bacterium]